MDSILILLFVLFQLILFTFIYRRTSKTSPKIRLATAAAFFVSTAHVIVRDFMGLRWYPTAIQAITAWILLYYFIKRIDGSKTWIRTHFWDFKSIVAIWIVYEFVNSIHLTSAGRRDNANNERLTITLHVLHLVFFTVFLLRTMKQLPSAAFFVYNFIVMLEPLGTTLHLFTEFPARILYCGEYYNCREYQLKLQYFLFSAFALIEILPAILLCLYGAVAGSEVPNVSQADDLAAEYQPIHTQEEDV